MRMSMFGSRSAVYSSDVHLLDSGKDITDRVDQLLETGVLDPDLIMDLFMYYQSVGLVDLVTFVPEIRESLEEYIGIVYCRRKYGCAYGQLPYRIRNNALMLRIEMGHVLRAYMCRIPAIRASAWESDRPLIPSPIKRIVNLFGLQAETERGVARYIKLAGLEINNYYYSDWGYNGTANSGTLAILHGLRRSPWDTDPIHTELAAFNFNTDDIDATYPRVHHIGEDLSQMYPHQVELIDTHARNLMVMDVTDAPAHADELARVMNSQQFVRQHTLEILRENL